MNIIQKLIPVSNRKTRPRIPMKPQYITIHETANTSKGADAAAHARLQYNGNVRSASWHFTVDQDSIYQSVPTNEVAWHAGDGGSGTGNRESIGIEICVNQDGNFTKSKANAAELVRYLMSKHGIPISRVVPHKHWTGKDCPKNILKSWSNFIGQVKNGTSVVVKPQSYDTNAEYHRLLKVTDPMMRGEDVRKVQIRLQSQRIDGIYGEKTRQDVISWQRVHDGNGKVVRANKGLEVDGIVGPKTWKALFG